MQKRTLAQVDWMVGEIIAELEALGIAERTLVIFTSCTRKRCALSLTLTTERLPVLLVPVELPTRGF